jgi:hypothetical protein
MKFQSIFATVEMIATSNELALVSYKMANTAIASVPIKKEEEFEEPGNTEKLKAPASARRTRSSD